MSFSTFFREIPYYPFQQAPRKQHHTDIQISTTLSPSSKLWGEHGWSSSCPSVEPLLGRDLGVTSRQTLLPIRSTRASPGVAERGAFKKGAEHKWKDKAPGRALPFPPSAHHTDSDARMSVSLSVSQMAQCRYVLGGFSCLTSLNFRLFVLRYLPLSTPLLEACTPVTGAYIT